MRRLRTPRETETEGCLVLRCTVCGELYKILEPEENQRSICDDCRQEASA